METDGEVAAVEAGCKRECPPTRGGGHRSGWPLGMLTAHPARSPGRVVRWDLTPVQPFFGRIRICRSRVGYEPLADTKLTDDSDAAATRSIYTKPILNIVFVDNYVAVAVAGNWPTSSIERTAALRGSTPAEIVEHLVQFSGDVSRAAGAAEIVPHREARTRTSTVQELGCVEDHSSTLDMHKPRPRMGLVEGLPTSHRSRFRYYGVRLCHRAGEDRRRHTDKHITPAGTYRFEYLSGSALLLSRWNVVRAGALA